MKTHIQVGGLLVGEAAAGVAAGEHFSLVVAQSGAVYGWGDGGSGQMGFKTERTQVRGPLVNSLVVAQSGAPP